MKAMSSILRPAIAVGIFISLAIAWLGGVAQPHVVQAHKALLPGVAQEGSVAGLGQPTTPLENMLNPDGTLNVKGGFSGSLDPKGWEMVSAPGMPPRFVRSSSNSNSTTSAQTAHLKAESPLAPGDKNWDGRFGDSSVNNNVNAIAVNSATGDVYVGGFFTTAGGASANYIAKWNRDGWSPLGSGMNNYVYALAVSGNGDVYAGGTFSTAGGVSAPYIAKWNGSAWSALGSGMSGGYVYALAVSGNGDVYAGGTFTTAGGVSANCIAKWNGSAWSALGSGMDGTVQALTVSGNGDVYAGGSFTTAGGKPSNYFGIWHSAAPPAPSPTSTPVPPTQTPGGPTATPVQQPTTCPIQFNDTPAGSPFYDYVRCLACRQILGGYACGEAGEPCPGNYFRPNDNVTRGQAAKIISNAAAYTDPIPPIQQTFADVPPSSPFWVFVERVFQHGAISGYACGRAGEPCPGAYFRPGANLTRQQLAKIATSVAGYTDPAPATPTFSDVPDTSSFYLFIERAHTHNIISGYGCGGAGEPCPGAYFRPGLNVTRGQTAKIVSGTFFPNCQTPAAR